MIDHIYFLKVVFSYWEDFEDSGTLSMLSEDSNEQKNAQGVSKVSGK